jgi:hypothetical protein
MDGSEAHPVAVFANLAGFPANLPLAENPVKCGLQAIENTEDKKRLKSLPR